MRALIGIGLVTVVAIVAWSVGPTVGKTHRADTINPLGLMTTPANLPTERYDAFEVVPET
jgi:hypothetical protein